MTFFLILIGVITQRSTSTPASIPTAVIRWLTDRSSNVTGIGSSQYLLRA
jgi:hypothetical protein